VTLTCKQITPHGSAPQGDVRWDVDVTRQDGESVARYDLLTLVATQSTPSPRTRPTSAGAEDT
jgi:oxepin-CoA hydrolase/3-oxo-5,6-dehydrosuberyl-CoA semialdehyde dehydrogenase